MYAQIRSRVVKVFAGIGVLTVGSLTVKNAVASAKLRKEKNIPGQSLIHLDLSVPLLETTPPPLAALLDRGNPPMSLRTMNEIIRKAAVDERVKGIICTFGAGAVPNLATAQEVRKAILDFREAQKALPPANRKFAWVAADTFGEAGQGSTQYYLASAFDKIFLQPSGLVGLIGISMQSLFFKDLLAKIGVQAQIFNYHEYKNAGNMFTESSYTNAHREQSQRLTDGMFELLVAGVASGRGLGEDRVKELVDQAPLNAKQAIATGLVDALMYPDQVVTLAKEEVSGGKADPAETKSGPQVIGMRRYAKAVQPREETGLAALAGSGDTKPRIALITAVGAIVRGIGDPTARNPQIGGDAVAAAVRSAYTDPLVKAIVVRVDSPGGSAVASDTIRRELDRAREAGRPVVVSMAGVAASGGYFIATGADRIVAQPGTITGSIGVIYGKMVVEGALKMLGVGVGEVKRGEAATSGSGTRPFTPGEAERARQLGQECYDDFTGHVMRSRSLSPAQVDAVARGRVWTGAQAHALGLVDRLGGLDDAHRLAVELAGLPADGPLEALPKLVDYPKKQSFVQKLSAALRGDKSEGLSAGSGGEATGGAAWAAAAATWLAEGTGLGDVCRAWELVAQAGAAARQLEVEQAGGVSMRLEEAGPGPR